MLDKFENTQFVWDFGAPGHGGCKKCGGVAEEFVVQYGCVRACVWCVILTTAPTILLLPS
jgi:hypothetical protein